MGEIEKGYDDSHVAPLRAMTQHGGKAASELGTGRTALLAESPSKDRTSITARATLPGHRDQPGFPRQINWVRRDHPSTIGSPPGGQYERSFCGW